MLERVGHVVGGSPALWLPERLEGDVIGVDRGALELVKRGVAFDVALGDFDSVSADEKQRIKAHAKQLIELEAEKDVTDCEAAVDHLVKAGHRLIYLYGVTGGRLDHQLSLMALMLKCLKRGIQLVVRDAQNELKLLAPGRHTLPKDTVKTYVSFFAQENQVDGLTTFGLKYPLSNYTLTLEDTLCVSNELVASEATVVFEAGYLLVVRSGD